mgnify:CR=1 FL=1
MRYEITSTEVFDKWLKKLRDRQAALAIAHRITRAAAGALGDVKPVSAGVSEMRIFVGKGYRLYFCMKGAELVVLLCGGNKATQSADIEKAKQLAKEV